MAVFRPTCKLEKTCLLTPADIDPVHENVEIIGAFNPAAIYYEDSIALLVRVAAASKNTDAHKVVYLSFEHGELRFHWLDKSSVDTGDPRVYRSLATNQITLTSLSYLQLFWIRDVHLECDQWRMEPGVRIMPEGECEAFGIEDPRCAFIDGIYYITYTSVSRHGPSTSMMTTRDFHTFDRKGVIFTCENKDVALFPNRHGGKYYALHRPMNRTPFCKPEMWSAVSPDTIHWGNHQPLILDTHHSSLDRVGGGTPPVRINDRYIALYHASEQAHGNQKVGTYYGSTIEFELCEDAVLIRSTSQAPFIYPDQPWELNGFVPQVVFPTALLVSGHRALIFYGAADENVGVAETSVDSLIGSLQ